MANAHQVINYNQLSKLKLKSGFILKKCVILPSKMYGYLKCWLTVLIVSLTINPTSVFAGEEERFCYEGGFESASGGASGDLLDLNIDADDYAGKEIIVISHLMISSSSSEAISGYVGPTKSCWFSTGRAMVDYQQGLPFEIRPFTIADPSDFRSVRRAVLKNTSSLSSLGHFKLKGVVKLYTNDYTPYLHVTDLEFVRLKP